MLEYKVLNGSHGIHHLSHPYHGSPGGIVHGASLGNIFPFSRAPFHKGREHRARVNLLIGPAEVVVEGNGLVNKPDKLGG